MKKSDEDSGAEEEECLAQLAYFQRQYELEQRPWWEKAIEEVKRYAGYVLLEDPPTFCTCYECYGKWKFPIPGFVLTLKGRVYWSRGELMRYGFPKQLGGPYTARDVKVVRWEGTRHSYLRSTARVKRKVLRR